MKCVRCGTELNENDKVCLGCGFEVGQKYEKQETSETLESLMEMPLLENDDENIDDDAEELNVDESLNVIENINGETVSVSTLNVATGDDLVKGKRKKKYWLLLIFLVLILCVFGIYKLVVHVNSDNDDVVPPVDLKPNVTNHPTSVYSFGNNFIYKINDLWLENTRTNNQVDVIESRMFITDGASLEVNLYSFDGNQLDSYTKYLGISTSYEETMINDVKYYVFTLENNKIYVKIVDNYLYAFEFTFSENIDNLINDIINNVTFYN